MYSEKDYQNASKQAKVRLITLILAAILLIVAIIIINRQRMQYIAMAIGAVGFIACYFLCSFKVTPWLRYNRFMREMKHGQRRKTECDFHNFSSETRMHDGVEVYEMIVSVGDAEEDERLYYWDVDKPQPQLKEGDRLCVESFGNFVVSLQLINEHA